jgi:hypothetical protein
VLAAAAGLTKFAPLALGPLFWRGIGPRWPAKRSLALYVLGFAAAVGLAMLPVVLNGNLHAFWQDSIAYQADRITPFSVWGLWGGLGLEQHLLEGAVAALAAVVAFVPRRRGVVEVAALAGAVVIALQLVANYWLYSYIVWFFPAVAVGLFGFFTSQQGEPAEAQQEVDAAQVQESVRFRWPASALSLGSGRR